MNDQPIGLPAITRIAKCVAALLCAGVVACGSQPGFRLTSGDRTAAIPFELHNNHIVLRGSIRGSHPVALILDSGASATALDASLVRRIGFPLGDIVASEGLGATDTVRLVEGVDIVLPGVAVTNLTVAAMRLDDLSAREGVALGGILGYDFMSAFLLTIDYDRRVVTLRPPNEPFSDARATRLSIRAIDERPFVRATLDLPSGTAIDSILQLDTGTSGAFIINSPVVRDRDLLRVLQPKASREGASVVGRSELRYARVPSARFAGVRLGDPYVALSSDPTGVFSRSDNAGIVGGEVLRRFVVTFDVRHGAVWLAPTSHVGDSFDYDASGLTLRATGADLHTILVVGVAPGSPAANAGVKVGATLASVDGDAVATLSLSDIRRRLSRGGSTVTLELREGAALTKRVVALRSLL